MSEWQKCRMQADAAQPWLGSKKPAECEGDGATIPPTAVGALSIKAVVSAPFPPHPNVSSSTVLTNTIDTAFCLRLHRMMRTQTPAFITPPSSASTAASAPARNDDDYGEFDDDAFVNTALMDKLLDIALARVKRDENLTALKDGLLKRRKAVERAARLRSQASKPKLDTALTTAATQLSSSQSEPVRQQLEQMLLEYGTPSPEEQQAEKAAHTAETARQTAKQALLGFEEARATIAREEQELARMQQSPMEEGGISGSGREDWRGRANDMAAMLDRTFLETGAYYPEKPGKMKGDGAWFCDELKLWYVAAGRQTARAACLAKWPELVLSYEQLQALLGKKYGWSDE
ncbi:hypothetical protein [Shinella kummerowiae]|uniref:hypothetical protein n=1 Tax=Shinella kummerowiae TaxID=417745 RepID=UPI0021B54678|nr:hypothetical protein [Shinella kummerowiae]MCT7667455.1 hypothetical protein [Shinella kummerowiae]